MLNINDTMNAVESKGSVAFAGDWHGNTGWALRAIRAASKSGHAAIFHVGDFGFWPGAGGASYVRKVNAELVRHDMLMFITLGNHEDYSQTNKAVQVQDAPKGFRHLPHLPHIIILDRGVRFTLARRSFMSIGGANSIDFQARVLGKSLWNDEQISDEDVEAARAGGHVEVMISHDTATGMMDAPDSVSDWSDEGLAYAQKSSDQLRRVMDEVQPVVNVFGHYHTYINEPKTLRVPFVGDYTVQAVCLEKEKKEMNVAVMSLSDLSVTPLNVFTA